MRGSTSLGIAVFALLALSCGKSSRLGPTGAAAGAGGSGGEAGGPSRTGGNGGDSARGGSGGASVGGTAGDTQGGEGGDGAEPATTSSVSLVGTPIYTRVQRLTNTQWENAVNAILRFEAPANLSRNFLAPVAGVSEFTNNEKGLFVDQQFALDYELAAEAAAALATGTPEALAALYDGTDATGFVQTFGRRAFRRPLSTEEVAKFEGVFALGEMLYGAGFANGAAVVIRAMLVSPHFLYRTELGASGEPLNGYEIASKLSFWLLGTTPEDWLLDAAEAGDLDSVEYVESVAWVMLEDPRSLSANRDFHGQLHHLTSIPSITKPGVPEYTPALAVELSDASFGFFDRVFAQDDGLRDILTSSTVFAGPELAPLYGVTAPGSGLELRELGPSRKGWLMQAAFPTLWSADEQSDPIRRGLEIHQNVLCAALPPPNDDLGFALETLDGMGRERTTNNGQPIDTSGSYPFAEGTKAFANAAELMQILADSPQAHTCYAKKVTGYGLQRDVVEADRPLLEALSVVSREQSLRETIVALVRDSKFRVREVGTP